MAVVSITIIESTDEIVAGTPRTVSLSANLFATIFYTLDGTDPTNASSVYTAPIVMSTSRSGIVLKIWASNGVDTSAVITNNYGPDMSGDRMPHAAITSPVISGAGLGPFGTAQGGTFQGPLYATNGLAGITISAPNLTTIPSGNFDGQGNPVGGTNAPLDQYQQVYSTTDAQGQTGQFIGTVPGRVKIIPRETQYGPESSNKSDKMFNPRAMVMFQDSSLEDPSDPVQLNREYMSLQNPEIVRDGGLLFANGLESPPLMGSFVRSFVNNRDHTITYYYFDSSVNKWLISKQPYQPNESLSNLSGMVFGRNNGGPAKVFVWKLYQRRHLF